MKRNMIKRIAAVAMAGAMMVSMSVPAMATEGSGYEPTNTFTFKKELTLDPYVYVPDAKYTFTITPCETSADDKVDGQPVLKGEVGGIANLTNNQFTISTDSKMLETYATGTEKESKVVGEKKLSVNPGAFKKPGIYRYTVTEEEPTYEGISKGDSKAQYLDVYIVQGKNGLEAKYFVLKDGVIGAKNDGKFENNYTTYSATVTKEVIGDQVVAGDNDEFSFTFSATPGIDGEKYCVTDKDGIVDPNKDGTWTVSLRDNESATIHGLTASDAYAIKEADYSDKGWKTTVTVDKGSAIPGTDNRSASGKGTDNAEITVTNTKDAPTPTGIVMDIAPYIIMVAAAGVLAFVFLRRRSYTK